MLQTQPEQTFTLVQKILIRQGGAQLTLDWWITAGSEF